MIEKNIATTTHGRYLVVPPLLSAPAPMLVGLHGYGETAGTQLDRLRAIPGSEEWLVVSIQGLHRYYQRRANEVVASWMTRQDRELAIADNLAYVASVVETVGHEYAVTGTLVLAGFSQGVAMTFRAATHAVRRPTGVIAVGGDVPPEILPSALTRVTSTLLCRGTRDEWYTAEKFGEDARRIREAGVDLRSVEFEGGHEWSPDVIEAASWFLRECRRRGDGGPEEGRRSPGGTEVAERDGGPQGLDIRRATADDATVLAELRWEFRAGRETAVEAHDAFVERCAEWMRNEFGGTRWRAWVALDAGRIVGQVWLDLIQKLPNPVGERERHAYLSNLYVQPAARGGAGTALLDTALQWASDHEIDRVVLWPSQRSISLYRRHRFTREGDVMELNC